MTRAEIQASKDYWDEERKLSKIAEPLILTDRAKWVICSAGHVYLATAAVTRCPGSNALNGKRKMCYRRIHLATPEDIEKSRKADCNLKAMKSCDLCSAKHGHMKTCINFKPRVYPERRKRMEDNDRRLQALTVRAFIAQKHALNA